MSDMDLNVLNSALAVMVALLVITGCTPKQTKESPLEVQLYQTWELQPGEVIAGYSVIGGLGDLSIALKGQKVYAPYDGKVQPHKQDCVIFSSEDVPNYLLRLCGLKRPQFGVQRSGEVIGSADTLQFAVLNKRPDGLWSLVEPSKQVIKQMLLPR